MNHVYKEVDNGSRGYYIIYSLRNTLQRSTSEYSDFHSHELNK